MPTLLPVPKVRFFDADGNPLEGGKVFTYAAGTTTPLATYTDYTGTAENTNPVILDANGEADIWLGDALYKITLTDAVNVVQWTVDNVGSMAQLSQSTGFGAATDIASGILVDLGTVTSHFANITGASNISDFGSTATLSSPIYLIKFEGALTLNNSATLILPGGTNIVTVAQDHALVEYLSSGAWRVVDYMRADGSSVNAKVASTTFSLTGDISPTQITANTDDYEPTGIATASVVRFSTDASRNLTGIDGGTDGRLLVLTNIGNFPLVLKHDTTSTAANRFFTPDSRDYFVRPNSSATLQYDATSERWRVWSTSKTYASGDVIQSVYVPTTSVLTLTGILVPQDNTIPQDSETGLVVSGTITPMYTSSSLRVTMYATGSTVASTNVQPFIFRDAGTDAVASGNGMVSQGNGTNNVFTVMAGASLPATALTATTIKAKVGVAASTNVYVNGNSAGTAIFGGTMTSWIKIEEIAV